MGQGRGVGAVQVDDRWAVACRHHMDESPRRAGDEPSLRVGSAQHPAVDLFDRGGVLAAARHCQGGHAPTIGPAAEVA